MKDSRPSPTAQPSDEELETMLSRTSSRLFDLPREHSGFLQRMLVIRNFTASLPAKRDSAFLVSVEGEAMGPAGYKPIKKSLSVGRHNNADWCVNDGRQKLSGSHFSITRRGTDYVLADLNSTNGTRVNENPERIKACLLHNGDFIRAGGCVFAFISTAD